MVLYEDLRIYTIWRTDMARAKASSNDGNQPTPNSSNFTINNKSAEEWEILGDLATRLHHLPEAVEAYQSCLQIRFSPKAMKAVVKMWETEKKSESMLQGMIRLIAWQYRWYSEVSGPHLVRFSADSSVLTGIAPHHSQIDRRGGRNEGTQHHTSYKSTTVSA